MATQPWPLFLFPAACANSRPLRLNAEIFENLSKSAGIMARFSAPIAMKLLEDIVLRSGVANSQTVRRLDSLKLFDISKNNDLRRALGAYIKINISASAVGY